MALELPNIPQIFKHSKDLDTGGGKERKGLGEFIVSLDGTGDFDTIQEAVNASTSTGQIILIKKGTYIIETGELVFKDNLTFRGEGYGTIIQFTGTTDKYIDFNEKDKIIFENLRIELKGDYDTWGAASKLEHMDITNCTDLEFRNVNFVNYAYDDNSSPGDIGIFHSDSSTRLKMKDCKIENGGSGNLGAIFFNVALSYSNITDNDITGIGLFGGDEPISMTYCIITNNRFSYISLLGVPFSDNIITNNIAVGVEGGDDDEMDRNIISLNKLTSTIYLGSSSNYNAVTGNIHNVAIVNNGTNNVLSGNVEY